MNTFIASSTIGFLEICTPGFACGSYPLNLKEKEFLSSSPAEHPEVVQRFRDGGQQSRDRLLALYREQYGPRFRGRVSEADANHSRFVDWIDAVAMQRDAHVSGLYWHTEQESANVAAAEEAGRIARSKAIVETPAMKMMRTLTMFVSQGTLTNKDLLAPRIHGWFTGGSSFVKEVCALNAQVYAQRFRMPPSDPWLGLAQPDIFSTLPANGLAGTVAP